MLHGIEASLDQVKEVAMPVSNRHATCNLNALAAAALALTVLTALAVPAGAAGDPELSPDTASGIELGTELQDGAPTEGGAPETPVAAVPYDGRTEGWFEPPKEHSAAFFWALGATVVPIVASATLLSKEEVQVMVIVSALSLGPSAGQFYAGSWKKGLVGTGVRLAGLPVGVLLGTILADNETGSDGNGIAELAAFFTGFVIGAGTMWVAGTAYSLIDAHRAVDRANEKARREWLSRVSLAPTLLPVSDGRTVSRWAPGVAFTASF